MSTTEVAPATTPAVPPDPLVHKSYSVPIAIAMLAVVVAAVLAIADEGWLRRPYKKIQGQYQETYTAYLEKLEVRRRDFEQNILLKLDEYQALVQAEAAAAEATKDARAKAEAELESVTQQSRKLGEALKVSKSEISALTYEAEDKAHAEGHEKVEDAPAAKPILEKLHKVLDREVEYSWQEKSPSGETSEKTEKGKVADLLVKAAGLEEAKAERQQVLGAASRRLSEATKARKTWLAANASNLEFSLRNADDATKAKIAASGAAKYLDESVVSLDPKALGDMRAKVDETYPHQWWNKAFRGEIKQTHIAEARNWVDRCETCHLNAREPMPITVTSLREVLSQPVTGPAAVPGEEVSLAAWDQAKIDSMPLALFTSHPKPGLLKTHDPDRFGCSMCHNGNGVAITSRELAHGENHHWLQPLFPKAHIEAGCVQCHQKDLVLKQGERINAGKDTFRRAGCWGCHKYDGFNKEVDEITALLGKRTIVEQARDERRRRSDNLQALLGAMDEDSVAKEREPTKRQRDALAQEIATLETERAQIDRALHGVQVERLRVGPNLKDVKVKLLRGFLTDWIRSPRDAHKDATGRAFRPETKMPTFRWADDEEPKDVAAFVYQSALDPKDFKELRDLPAFTPGDAKHGEALVTDKGCLACHSIGIGDARTGNDVAANLSNLGEKNNPAYVARWVTHARERLVGFDPTRPPMERDVTGASKDDPNVVWTQPVIMPNFRLSDSEVRDITTFLVSQKRSGVKYEDAPWLDDPERAKRGRKLVLFQGCAGCHEIRGLEDEKGIGTELTKEGSKPRDQLDFGHLTIAAERGVEPLKEWRTLDDDVQLFPKDEPWYRTRGFVLHKIAKPDVYDESKFLPDRFTRLRMPQFKFAAQEIIDVTTFVLGSVDSRIPESFRYNPGEAGQAIREGWWIVKKYNCQGCHQIEPADEPSIGKVPFFADKPANQRDQFFPPTLVGVGFRLKPEFLAAFLRDPSLGGDRARPQSVRPHLPVRMPTFDFSEDEIRKLVLFFGALAKQPAVYQPPVLPKLTAAERTAASAMWKSANCMQCHVVDGMTITPETKAPNLTYAPERLRPEWVRRWIADPPGMQPATSMTRNFGDSPGPDGKWHFTTPLPELQGIPADHVDLVTRYILEGLAGK